MKLKCIYHSLVQDKYNGSWYEPNKEYEVTKERGKELIESGYFELVEEPKKPKQIYETDNSKVTIGNNEVKLEVKEVAEEKPKKSVKKSTK